MCVIRHILKSRHVHICDTVYVSISIILLKELHVGISFHVSLEETHCYLLNLVRDTGLDLVKYGLMYLWDHLPGMFLSGRYALPRTISW